MPTIKLVVTGEMEKGALHTSLQGVFSGMRENQAVHWLTPHRANGATSACLPQTNKPVPKMIDLANTMIAEVLYSNTGQRPDLVLVIDDLELNNAGQEALVARHFRLAIEAAINKSPKFMQKEVEIRRLLRERCSFHLLKPMVESYLFGDGKALQKVTSKKAKLPAGLDLEQFETNDDDYLPHCKAINARHPDAPNWREECHPKRYLQFLNPDYSETGHGKAALEALNWGSLTNNAAHLQVIRALFTDLAQWFGIPNPLPGQAHPEFWVPSAGQHGSMVLRNM
jgi:hypothetical protein